MIGISTIDQNTTVPLVLNESRRTRFREIQPRVQRYPTLDGDAAIVHLGTVTADMTLFIHAERVSEADCDILWGLRSDTQLVLFTRKGMYLGTIADLKTDNGEVSFTFYVKEELDA